MNKELEWYEIITELQCNPQDYEPKEIEEMMYELEEKLKPIIALTPPTADEIVKEYKLLKGYEDKRIEYKDGNFIYYPMDKGIMKNTHITLAGRDRNGYRIQGPITKEFMHKITSFFMEWGKMKDRKDINPNCSHESQTDGKVKFNIEYEFYTPLDSEVEEAKFINYIRDYSITAIHEVKRIGDIPVLSTRLDLIEQALSDKDKEIEVREKNRKEFLKEHLEQQDDAYEMLSTINAIKEVVKDMEQTEYTDCEMVYDEYLKIKQILEAQNEKI